MLKLKYLKIIFDFFLSKKTISLFFIIFFILTNIIDISIIFYLYKLFVNAILYNNINDQAFLIILLSFRIGLFFIKEKIIKLYSLNNFGLNLKKILLFLKNAINGEEQKTNDNKFDEILIKIESEFEQNIITCLKIYFNILEKIITSICFVCFIAIFNIVFKDFYVISIIVVILLFSLIINIYLNAKEIIEYESLLQKKKKNFSNFTSELYEINKNLNTEQKKDNKIFEKIIDNQISDLKTKNKKLFNFYIFENLPIIFDTLLGIVLYFIFKNINFIDLNNEINYSFIIFNIILCFILKSNILKLLNLISKKNIIQLFIQANIIEYNNFNLGKDINKISDNDSSVKDNMQAEGDLKILSSSKFIIDKNNKVTNNDNLQIKQSVNNIEKKSNFSVNPSIIKNGSPDIKYNKNIKNTELNNQNDNNGEIKYINTKDIKLQIIINKITFKNTYLKLQNEFDVQNIYYAKNKLKKYKINDTNINENQDIILEDINLEIKEKTSNAIITSDYSNTFLIGLIKNFSFTVMSGDILINDINIKNLDIKKLDEFIMLVNSYDINYENTIRENVIFYNQSASEEIINRTFKITGLIDSLASFPLAHNTHINDVILTDIQKFQISLSKAFLSEAQVIILDFTSITNEDEDSIKKIKQICIDGLRDRIVIFITNNTFCFEDITNIIFFEQNRIKYIGSHQSFIEDANKDYLRFFTNKSIPNISED
jgi:ABC-type multidrug transport system fused ATPase/permease subunit